MLSSVGNALDILDLLGKKELLGVAEISKELKLGKTSVFRLLYTLEAKGFVIRDGHAKYMLSKKFSYLGEVVAQRKDDYALARPELIKLRDKVNETVHMSVLLSNKDVMFVEKISTSHSLQMQSKIGFEMPAYCSGMGKVLLASLLGTEREEELKTMKLARRTNTTISDYDELIKELSRVKAQGYGIDKEESEVGLACVAVPVLDQDGNCHIAISISGVAQRILENADVYIKELKKTAKAISELLGL